MKTLFALPILALLILSSFSIQEKKFPELKGTTLSGTEMTLPHDNLGQYTLVGMAYSKKAEADLNTWMEPLFNHFIYESANSMFPVEESEKVNLVFVPMFTGAKAALEGKARKKMAAGIDPRFHDQVLMYAGSNHDFKQLNTKNHDVPHFFLISPEGEIAYQTSGAYSGGKLAQMDDILDGE